MSEITELQAKEALKVALMDGIINNVEYTAIIESLQEGKISPTEVYEGYLPFKLSNSRHR